MVTLKSAENVLKEVYLGVLQNQLNVSVNPLLSKIKRTTKDVWGKEIIKLAPFGINGGVMAGGENDRLPNVGGNNYVQFRSTLKNLYGRIQITDKAVRASQNNLGAFVSLLADEMDGLVKSSIFNLGRMLYSDGSGRLAKVKNESIDYSGPEGVFTLDRLNNVVEGMIVDICSKDGVYKMKNARILQIDREKKQIITDTRATPPDEDENYLCVQSSYNNEITGINALFSKSDTLYGVNRSEHMWLNPYVSTTETEISDNLIQSAIDFLEEYADSKINYIACSKPVRRAYQQYLTAYRSNIDILNLDGGFKAISYNGIPLVGDRFVEDDTMFLLNTNDFTMHELCDWTWLSSENGDILKQNEAYPYYTATLVKYAELICDKPNGQAKISGIKSTVTNPFIANATKTSEITTEV